VTELVGALEWLVHAEAKYREGILRLMPGEDEDDGGGAA
jgi:hypothetical protein